MKKILLSAAMMAIFSMASAAEVITTIGASSNYVDRGVSLSDENPSVTAAVLVKLPDGLFGSAQTSTIRLGNGDQLENIATVGYQDSVGGVDFSTGVSYQFYTGNEKFANRQNFGEVFGTASYKGANALITRTVSTNDTGARGTYMRVGYTGEYKGFAGDIGTSYTFYSGSTQHTATDLSVSYRLFPNTKVEAKYSLGGSGSSGQRLQNQRSVGVTVSF